ncbi:polysaccharide pyruvyl transferase family protein [Tenacibaculum sp. 47A_GOM-205m]|uniref:polysaccharide pyruvyl transferase family protein n=1 Tax=Tenacibaculum sp. 47A_GOM-205m TaxID=1380384 RepID=UPI0004B26849|nr:polysaccharide pyruvyl transferase family protein [Tenacibaculum sp. 47A_GOM-205m]
MRIKIKTITCHEVYNHGASLQEYALLQFLNTKGHQSEALHYKPEYLSGHFKLWTVSNPKFNLPILKQAYLLAKLPQRLKNLARKKKFDEFAKRYIPTDSVLYKTNHDLKQNLPDADVFICGSDQIWNSFFQNGKDPAFYLNFVPNTKLKIAYAASFAIDELEEDIKPLVKENVSRLDAVGVREISGVRILKDLGLTNAVQVLDPVFLLDRAHWNKFMSPIKEDYIFVYDFDSNPTIKEVALCLKKLNGWKIYSVNQNIDYADKVYWYDGPEKFLSLVSQSQMNITNSFHSTAFSIIFEKQLVVVNREEKINTRMRDLLSLFNLNERLITTINEFNSLKKIDYKQIKTQKESCVKKSQEFLCNVLNK